MPLLLLLIIEIVALFLVGELIGALPTLLLVLGGSVLGGVLLRREGDRAMAAMQEALLHRRLPEDTADPTRIVAAILLLIPGLVTSFAGLLVLLPGSRALARRGLRRVPRVVVRTAGPFPQAGARPGAAEAGRRDVIDGEVIEGEVVEGPEPTSGARPAGDATPDRPDDRGQPPGERD